CEESAPQSYQRAVEEPCCRPEVPRDPLLHVQVILILQTQCKQQHEYDEGLSQGHEFRSPCHILCFEPLHVQPLRHRTRNRLVSLTFQQARILQSKPQSAREKLNK